MPLFVVVLAVLLGLLSWFLHRRLANAPAWSSAVRRGLAVALLVGWVLSLGAFASTDGLMDPHVLRPATWIGMTWLSVVFYLALGSFLTGLISLVLRGFRGTRTAAARRSFHRVAAPLVIVTALATTGYGLHEAAMPTMTAMTLTSERLPAGFVGMKVALITDLHVGPVRDASFTQRVVDSVNAQKPDLVVLGGDLVDGTVPQTHEDIDPIRNLKAPLGVVAVSGNHEFISGQADAWMDYWKSLGVNVLRNSSIQLTRHGDRITVAGINDLMGRGADAPDVAAALKGQPRSEYTVLVAHEPLQAEDAQGRGIDLQLSGHTHGGQLWPFGYAVAMQQPAISGLTPVGDIPVVTSLGAGAWGPPVRVLAPPEVPIVTLEHG